MIIRDIKLYCSDMDNVDGYPMPKLLDYPAEEAMVTRIAMRLNEKQFELGDYSELKINFTPCLPNNIVQHALRTPTSKNAHYVDVGVTRELFTQLKAGDPAMAEILIPCVRHTLLVLYGKHHPERQDIRDAVDSTVAKGAEAEFCIMEKQGLFSRGQLLVKYSDSGSYLPRLYVTDRQGNQMLDKVLSPISSLDKIKQFQLGFNKATVHYLYGDVSQESFPYVR